MKNCLLFILILANNVLHACGYYPYGEDTRISLFSPSVFGYGGYSSFYYSADAFSPKYNSTHKDFVLPNNKLWFEYCQEKVSIKSIHIAVYKLRATDINEDSRNDMIQYLYQQKDSNAINYLRFAKNCEFFNSWQEDPWERKKDVATAKRADLINKAVILAQKVQKPALKKRYTFLAIRLAWYNGNSDQIQSLFSSVFENTKDKDILYYWSLYFKNFTDADIPRANFNFAQIFANTPDKRFVCYQRYKSKIPIEQVLKFSQTDIEKANVYLLYSIDKPDKKLSSLQKIYALNPTSRGLSFLLLRELNKIEDYVLTPYYTLFEPSVNYWGNKFTGQILNRSEQDRLYAKKVLQFVNSVDLKKVENPLFWQSSKAYLQFITRDYNACLKLIVQLEKSTVNKTIIKQLHMIKALALTAKQASGSAIIPTEVESIIIENQKNGQFIFAIGKELEYLGNTSDAAILYAKLNKAWDYDSFVYWKTRKNKKYTYSDYFVDYYEYVDVVYTPEQTQFLINDIQKYKDHQDSFSVFKYKTIKNEIPRLYDLLGTKYIRQNKLENALASFEKIEAQYLSRAYTLWDDRRNFFDKNPFYDLKYTPAFIPPKDPIRLNKLTITKQLINFLDKAEDKNEKNRDYYYFLVANAYYNMGQKGNVSMMRRINRWSGHYFSIIEDEVEFRQSNLAKKYYLSAKKHAKTDKFAALCLRMVTRCEKNRLLYKEYLEGYNRYNYNFDSLLATNQYYKELQENYPDYFDDLTSNCNGFGQYFDARR